jgi:O-antigen/teichoic acid export membrane protein
MLLRSLASSWLGLAVGIVVSFFLSPFVVNKLGSTWYGVWAVASQFVGYLYLMDFGVRESVVRYTSKYAARRNSTALNHVLSTSLLAYAVITMLALLVVAVAVWGLPHWFSLEPALWRDGRIAMAFTGLTIALTFLLNVFTGVVIGLKRWEISNAVGVVLNLLRAGLIVYFLLRGHGIVALAAVQFFVAVLGGAINVFIALGLLRRASLSFRFTLLRPHQYLSLGRRILGYGFYVIVNNVGEKIISATDAIVVGIFMPIQAVAYFAVAGSLIGYLTNLLSTSAAIFNPLASELHSLRQKAGVTAAFYLGVKVCGLITLPVVATFVILGEEFIGLWMGPEFSGPSSVVLTVLAVATFVASPKYVFSSVLYGMSRHRIIALLRIGEAVANLGLSILLVQNMGLAGVALGTAIPSVIVAVFVLPVIAGRAVGITLPQFYEHAFVRPLVAIAPFAAAAFWVRAEYPASDLLGFFLRIFALLFIYVPCAFAVVLNREERQIILERIGLTRLLG